MAFTTYLYRSRDFDITTGEDTIRVPDNIVDVQGVFPSDAVKFEEEKEQLPVPEEKISVAVVQNAIQVPAVSANRTNSSVLNANSIMKGGKIKIKKLHKKKHVKPNPRPATRILPFTEANNTSESKMAGTGQNLTALSNTSHILDPNSVNRTNEQPSENRITTGSIVINNADIGPIIPADKINGNSSSANFGESSNTGKGKTFDGSQTSSPNVTSGNATVIGSITNTSLIARGSMSPLLQLQTNDNANVVALDQLAATNDTGTDADPLTKGA